MKDLFVTIYNNNTRKYVLYIYTEWLFIYLLIEIAYNYKNDQIHWQVAVDKPWNCLIANDYLFDPQKWNTISSWHYYYVNWIRIISYGNIVN